MLQKVYKEIINLILMIAV